MPDSVNEQNAAETPIITERDMLGAAEVLQAVTDEGEVFMELTDEELLALDGMPSLTMLGSPFLDAADIDFDNAAAVALRSLTARHLISRPGAPTENEGDVLSGEGRADGRPMQLHRRLAGVLTLRRIPEGMVIARRTLDAGTSVLAHYFYPDGAVLEEFVSADGFHHFAVPPQASLPERLVTFSDPFGDATKDSEPRRVGEEETEEQLGISGARAMTVFTSIIAGDGYQATAFALPGRMRVLDSGRIEPGEPGGREGFLGEATIGDVSQQSLQEMLAALLPVDSAAQDA